MISLFGTVLGPKSKHRTERIDIGLIFSSKALRLEDEKIYNFIRIVFELSINGNWLRHARSVLQIAVL